MALAARAFEREAERRPRRLKQGARVRRVRVRAARSWAKLLGLAALPVLLVTLYVWMTAELTAQTYRLHDDQVRQAALLAHDTDLRQQVAKLESLPRLEAAAASLHMQVPSKLALVPAPHSGPAAPAQTAFAASLADVRTWFGIR